MSTAERFLSLFRFLAISPAEVAEYSEARWTNAAELLRVEMPKPWERRAIVHKMREASEAVCVGSR